MKKWLLFGILALGAAGRAQAQESGEPALAVEASGSGSANVDRAAMAIASQQLTSAALAEAAPESQQIYRDTIYRWELGVGFTYVKFRSPAIDASMAGLNTSVTYFAKDWLGVEGNISAAFGRSISRDNSEKYASFTGGPKIAMQKQGWEPWLHALVGMGRVSPQLAGLGRNGFAIQMGGGADIALRGPFAARVEGDWVRTQLYNSSQNNFQIVAGIVFHLSF